MKQFTGRILFMVIITGLFISCDSTHYLLIETQQPAKLTFPIGSPLVVVANNAVSQPDSIGFTSFRIKLNKNAPDKESASGSSNKDKDKDSYYKGKVPMDTTVTNIKLSPGYTDSLLWTSIKTFSKEIQAAQFFYDVSFYDKPLRTDKEWIKTQPVSKEEVSGICEAIDADAVVSIDKLLFLLEQQVNNQPYDEVGCSTVVTSQIICSVYLRDRDKPLTTFSVNDTLVNDISLYKTDVDPLLLYQMIPESMLHASAIFIGEKLADYITPAWKTTQRVIYTSHTVRSKEALSHIEKDKWIEAQQIWMESFNSKSDKDRKFKARLANNIAVSYEMQDDLDSALEWIQKSREYYKMDNPTKVSKETEWISHYEEELNKRIRDNELLDMQLNGAE